MKIFAKIRFYWGAFIISAFVGLGMIPLITLFPKYKGLIMHKLNRVILFFMGAKVKTYGSRDNKTTIFIMNHQGIMDIIALEAVENTHFRWVAKKELFETPWFGHLLKNGDMISVDRQNKAGLLKFLKDAKITVEEKNRAIAIFPEGTRNPNQKLLSFKAGPKLIANKLHLRIQPIVITGSKNILNEHDRTAHRGTINLHYLEAFNVDGAQKDWYEKTKEHMQNIINREYQKGVER